MLTLWTTNVGSHAWSMNDSESDIDHFDVYITSSKKILNGSIIHSNSHHSGNSNPGEVDLVSHEIGKVINELIKGNINYLIGTLSPIVVSQHEKYLDVLKKIVVDNCQSTICSNSIKGLAIHNYNKYIKCNSKLTDKHLTKKCNLINRTLLFGINILKGNGFVFTPIKDQTPDDVVIMLNNFNTALDSSILPNSINEQPFRNYLLQLRLRELNDKL